MSFVNYPIQLSFPFSKPQYMGPQILFFQSQESLSPSRLKFLDALLDLACKGTTLTGSINPGDTVSSSTPILGPLLKEFFKKFPECDSLTNREET